MSNVLEDRTLHCIDVTGLFCDYVDGELSRDLVQRVDEHVEHCAACEQMLYSYQKTIQLAKHVPQRTVSVEAQNRLRANLSRRLGIAMPMVEA